MTSIRGIVEALGFLLLCYAVLLLVILVHETGHLLAGLVLGMRLIRIRVGPFEVRQPEGLNRTLQWNGVFTGVIFLRAGRRAMRATALRHALMILAGPLANIASIALAAAIFRNVTSTLPAALYFVGLSLCVSAGNLIPWRSRGIKTDGYQLCSLMFSKEARKRTVLGVTLTERVQELREFYATGTLDEVRGSLDAIIRTFDLLPELANAAEAKAKLAELRSDVEKAILSQAEQLPENSSLQRTLSDLGSPSAVS